MRSFVKIKAPGNSEITLLFSDIGKPCPSREFLMLHVYLLTLFAKIKFPQKFLNLQLLAYTVPKSHLLVHMPLECFKKVSDCM